MKFNLRYYLPGAMMIALSLLIVAVPEILVVFVASLLGMFGIAALYLGHMLRKEKIEIIRTENRDLEADFFDGHFGRIPEYRYCRRW